MKSAVLIVLYFLLLGAQGIVGQDKNEPNIESTFSLYSKILKEDRNCLISLPASYNDVSSGTKKYPILILLDGTAHFKTASGIVHFLSTDQTSRNLMPETIIIAIENVDRERDFTVTKIKTKRPNTMGGGRKFLNFIETELIPYIDKEYNTKPIRTLVGHSLGGLLTLNSYMDENSIFDNYISIDPSVWWDEKQMNTKVNASSTRSIHKKLYIATANQGEDNTHRNKKRHDAFVQLMKNKFGEDVAIELEYFEKENHRSVVDPAISQGLKFINH